MTNLDPIVRALREQLPELEILEYEPMRAHCSFRIGAVDTSILSLYTTS